MVFTIIHKNIDKGLRSKRKRASSDTLFYIGINGFSD